LREAFCLSAPAKAHLELFKTKVEIIEIEKENRRQKEVINVIPMTQMIGYKVYLFIY
jgi:hypothetical protein